MYEGVQISGPQVSGSRVVRNSSPMAKICILFAQGRDLHDQFPFVPVHLFDLRTTISPNGSRTPIMLETLVRGHYPARNFLSSEADIPQPNPDSPKFHEGTSKLRIWRTGPAWDRPLSFKSLSSASAWPLSLPWPQHRFGRPRPVQPST